MSLEKGTTPRLRSDLEIIPTAYRGERAVVVRDFLGLVKKPLLFRGEGIALLGLLDGRRTIEDVQVEFIRLRRGAFVSAEDIGSLLEDLDTSLLLETPRFHEARDKLIRGYFRLQVRRPILAGHSYPREPEDLRALLKRILDDGGEETPAPAPEELCALVAPHIELETGKAIYGRAYRAIRGHKPRLIVLLGTGHSLTDGLFSVTEKDFETPLGIARTDKRIVKELKSRGEKVVAPHDLTHRHEHSLEIQVVFLQYLFGEDFALVPILCGSFEGELKKASRPGDIPGVSGFLDVLRGLDGSGGRDVLFVAGVDFSHIGPKFGHREKAASLLLEAREHDRTLIEAARRRDVPGFWAEVARVGNRYNVCGFSSLTSLLEILPPADGVNLGYEFWEEDATDSAVSYAAIAFKRA